MHGSATKAARAKAALAVREQGLRRRVAEDVAAAEEEPWEPLNPLDEFQRLLLRVVRWEQALSSLVGKATESGASIDETVALVNLWERAMDRAAKLLVEAQRLGDDVWYRKHGLPLSLVDAEIARLDRQIAEADRDAPGADVPPAAPGRDLMWGDGS